MGRRRVLAALGGATAVGLAGCQEVPSQSFEASPVVLPGTGQATLHLGEVATDDRTVERSVLDGAATATFTSHTAVYSRAVGLGGR